MSIENPTIETHVEQQIVESVEKLPISETMKVDLLLICGGLKQATEVEIGKQWSPSELPQVLSEEEIIQHEKILQEIGLQTTKPIREQKAARDVVEGEEAPYIEYGQDIARFYVAKEKLVAERLKEAGKTEDDRIYGELSGFPVTAIEAYIANEKSSEDALPVVMSREELPDEIRKQDFMAFAEFMFSREHWRDEIETARRWSEEIRRVDPKLHARMVESYSTSFKPIEAVSANPEQKDKEERLEKIRSELENVTDAVGKHIDEGIKENVAVFNAVGIPTYQSCEGHENTEEGRPYPWMAIADGNEPEERYVGEREAFEKAAEEHNVPLNDLVKRFEPNDVWNKVMDEIMPRGETTEYSEWTERNYIFYEYTGKLLDEFYKGRTVGADVQLVRVLGAGNEFEVHSEQTVDFDELSEAEKQNVLAKLPVRQKEMAEFTEFLRKYYFSEGFDLSKLK